MKNKTTAAILAFFLGGIGGHRFYLGQIGLGIVCLIFFWTLIPAIIAFIDTFIFLTMSEESFNLKYNRAYIQMYRQQPTVVINNTNQPGNFAPSHNDNLGKGQSSTLQNKEPKTDPFELSGNEKYENYDFDGAIKDYLKSLNVRPNNPEIHFKLGCLYSILEQVDSSFFHISKGVEKGFYDIEKIKSHDNLAFLRSQQPAFDNFVSNGYKLLNSIEPSKRLNLSDENISKIEKLAKMKDQGIITDEEFQTQKSKLLNH